MELGYFSMPLHPPGSNPTDWLVADLDQLVELDRLGYDEAWIGEHYTNEWEPLVSPELFIARALGVTKNIRLGTGVNSLSYHHPVHLASRIALLDHMAQGRFMWGVGNGALPTDGALFGIDFASGQHRAGSRAVLDAVLDLWDNPEPGEYETEFFSYKIPVPNPVTSLRYHMQPFTKPHPPIAAAGTGPTSDMISYAGANGWIPMSVPFVIADTIKKHWEVYEEAAAASGKDFVPDRRQWRVGREIIVADTNENARDLARTGSLGRDWGDYIIPLFKTIKSTINIKITPDTPDEALDVDYCIDNVWIVGDVDTVTQKIHDLYDLTGGFGVLTTTGHEWDAEGRMKESARLLAEAVRPQLPTPAAPAKRAVHA